MSSQFIKFRRNFSKILQGGLTGTTTSIFTSSSTCLCPRYFPKSNRNSCQNPTGILTKVSPNFLLSRKKEALRGFLNPLILWQSFFSSHHGRWWRWHWSWWFRRQLLQWNHQAESYCTEVWLDNFILCRSCNLFLIIYILGLPRCYHGFCLIPCNDLANFLPPFPFFCIRGLPW